MDQANKISIPGKIFHNWREIIDLLIEITKAPVALIMKLKVDDKNNKNIFVTASNEKNPFIDKKNDKIKSNGLFHEKLKKEDLTIIGALNAEFWGDNLDLEKNIDSYPIKSTEGETFGIIYVLDSKKNNRVLQKLILKIRNMILFDIMIVNKNNKLGKRIKDLSHHLSGLQNLNGIVKICANCKRIKDKNGDWKEIEQYLVNNPNAEFSHGICSVCMNELYPEFMED